MNELTDRETGGEMMSWVGAKKGEGRWMTQCFFVFKSCYIKNFTHTNASESGGVGGY